eukprot:jgi/Bigna1/86767/estExt_fgenesh1_pg.C_130206
MESADMKAEFLHGFCDGKGLEAHITAVVNRSPLPSNFRQKASQNKSNGFLHYVTSKKSLKSTKFRSNLCNTSPYRTFNHITQDDRGKILIVTLESPDAYFTRDLRRKALALAGAKSCVQTATNNSKHAAKDTQTPSTTSPGIGRNDEESEEKDVSDNKKITRMNDEGSVASVVELLPLQIKVVSVFSLVERARGGSPDAVHALFPPLKEMKNEGGGRVKTVASFIFESKEWKELREGHDRSGSKQHPLKFEVTRTYLKALHE